MKIREFLHASFTNPFGNLLAIANLTLLFVGTDQKLMSDLNRPAIIVSQIIGGEFTAGLFVLQLIYLQWIFIGGFAKSIAAKIRPEIY